MLVRSYRRARRDSGKFRLPRTVFTFTYVQGAFGLAGFTAGLLVGNAVGNVLWLSIGGLVGGMWFGTRNRDGRDPARWLLAGVFARRSAWSPRWGTLRATSRVVKYRATIRPGGEEGWG